jgi:hypothetical protein
MEYVTLLQRAWQIISRSKILWLFGLIAVLAGQDAVFNLRSAFRLQPLAEAIVNPPAAAANALYALSSSGTNFLLDGLIIFVGLMLTAFGAIASAALIGLTQNAERGLAVNFLTGLHIGVKRIWPLLGIRLIFNLPAVVLSLIVTFLMTRLIDFSGPPLSYPQMLQVLQNSGVLPLLLMVGVVFGVLIGAIGVGADRACVLEETGVVESLKRGRAILRRNVAKYMVITGIFIASTLLIVFTFACPLALIFTDRVNQLAQAAPPGSDITYYFLNDPAGLIIGLILLAVYGGVTAYTSIVWTLAYRRYG